jgi:hypothetical protein
LASRVIPRYLAVLAYGTFLKKSDSSIFSITKFCNYVSLIIKMVADHAMEIHKKGDVVSKVSTMPPL